MKKYPLSKRTGVDFQRFSKNRFSGRDLTLSDKDVFPEGSARFKLTSHDTYRVVNHTKAAKNPNPKSNDDSYIQHRVHTARKSYYSEPLSGWTLSPEDRSLIRHLTKKYKKTYNRKPPGYYDNKKKKK